jgi:thioredoxin-like negative regulator of GroEL
MTDQAYGPRPLTEAQIETSLRDGHREVTLRHAHLHPALSLDYARLRLPPDAEFLPSTSSLRHVRSSVQEIQLRVHEAGLNQWLRSTLERQPHPAIEHLEVRFHSGHIRLGLSLRPDGQRTTPLLLTAQLVPWAGVGQSGGDVWRLIPGGFRCWGEVTETPVRLLHEVLGSIGDRYHESTPPWSSQRPRPVLGWSPDGVLEVAVGRILWLCFLIADGWKLPVLTDTDGFGWRSEPNDGSLRLTLGVRQNEVTGVGIEALALQQTLSMLTSVDNALRAGNHEQASNLLAEVRGRPGLERASSVIERQGYLALATHDDIVMQRFQDHLRQNAPPAGELLYWEVLLALRRGQTERAAQTLRQLLAHVNPNVRPLDLMYALLTLARLERPEHPQRAVASLREALRGNPEHTLVLEALSEAYLHSNQAALRSETLRRLLAQTSPNSIAWRQLQLSLALALENESVKDWRGAMQIYQALINVKADDFDAHIGIVRCLAATNQLAAALQACLRASAQATATHPHHAADLLARAARLWLSASTPDSHEQAIIACQRALALDPDLDDAHRCLIDLLFDREQFEDCLLQLQRLRSTLQRRLSSAPPAALPRIRDDLADVLRTSTQLLLQCGRESQAAAVCRELLEHAPHDGFGLATLERYLSQHDSDGVELIDLLETRLDVATTAQDTSLRITLLRRLASLYHDQLDLTERACSCLQLALSLVPASDDATLSSIEQDLLDLLRRSGLSETLQPTLLHLASNSRWASHRFEALILTSRLYIETLSDLTSAIEALTHALDCCISSSMLLRLLDQASSLDAHDLCLDILRALIDASTSPQERHEYSVQAAHILRDILHRPDEANALEQQASTPLSPPNPSPPIPLNHPEQTFSRPSTARIIPIASQKPKTPKPKTLPSPPAPQPLLDPSPPTPILPADDEISGDDWSQFFDNSSSNPPLPSLPPPKPPSVRSFLDQARLSNDPSTLRDALISAIAAEPNLLTRAKLHQELGSLAYFDLDDPSLARLHLEAARDADPDGIGLSPDTLTALEGLYEDLLDYESLLDIYQTKLQQQQTPEMRVVYLVLMAQTCSDHLDNPSRAHQLLSDALSEDPSNEAALKALASLESSLNNFPRAAQLLERLLSTLPDDSFEASDARIALANLYLDHLDQPRKASDLLWATLHASSSHIEQILSPLLRACLILDDGPGALDVISRKLSLLLGEQPAHSDPLQNLLSIDPTDIPDIASFDISDLLSNAAETANRLLNRRDQSWRLQELALILNPDDPSIIDPAIDLSRQQNRWQPLSDLLQHRAEISLDHAERFNAYLEASEVAEYHLHQPPRAIKLIELALQSLPKGPPPAAIAPLIPTTITRLERLRSAQQIIHVSIGRRPVRPPTPPFLPPKPIPQRPISPPTPITYDDSGILDFDNDDTQQRLEQISSALSENNDRQERIDLLTERGLLLSRNPETQNDALISLRAALALDPLHSPARLAMIDALIATGELEQAFNHLAALVQHAPSPLPSHLLPDIQVLLEIFISTGHPRIRPRARAILEQLSNPSTP